MRESARWAAALVALLAASGAPALDETTKKPDAAKALDAALHKSLREVINRGAGLYNKGEHAACYRVFQGGLTAAEGLLDHHADLQKVVAAALAGAERDPLIWRRAFTLRAALDKVRKGLAPMAEEKKDKDKPPAKDDDMKKADDEKKEVEKKDEVKKDKKERESDD